MSGRHRPVHGADSVDGWPDNFDDRGPADFVCDGCLRTIYTGLLARVDGKLLCERCVPLPTYKGRGAA